MPPQNPPLAPAASAKGPHLIVAKETAWYDETRIRRGTVLELAEGAKLPTWARDATADEILAYRVAKTTEGA